MKIEKGEEVCLFLTLAQKRERERDEKLVGSVNRVKRRKNERGNRATEVIMADISSM